MSIPRENFESDVGAISEKLLIDFFKSNPETAFTKEEISANLNNSKINTVLIRLEARTLILKKKVGKKLYFILNKEYSPLKDNFAPKSTKVIQNGFENYVHDDLRDTLILLDVTNFEEEPKVEKQLKVEENKNETTQ